MTAIRPTASSITDAELSQLYQERKQARASLAGTAARLRQVSAERDQLRAELAGIRAELTRSENARDFLRQRADNAEAQRARLAAALAEVLGAFRTVTNGLGDVLGHQGQPIHPDDFARWRAVLDAAPEAATVPRAAPQPSAFRKFITWAPGCDTSRHTYHPGLTCEQADAQAIADRAWLARQQPNTSTED